MEKKSIKDIALLMEEIEDENQPLLMELRKDERKGVQNLIKKWEKQRERAREELQRYEELSRLEKDEWAKGNQYIAGIDEVGRGPLAGPVVSAAVILKQGTFIQGLNDSKKINEKNRERMYVEIMEQAESVAIGIVEAAEIDQINIYEATKKSMRIAVEKLTKQPDILFIDAMNLNSNYPEISIIKGDANSISIAAASVIAKVTRDKMMKEYDEIYPYYGFAQNMGYGTKTHLEAITIYGPCDIHRQSFAPIKK